MSKSNAAQETAQAAARALLKDTELAQTAASDPNASAWVSANAGAGKTHVLKRRVLRILLSGTAPNRILCLTYTKAAAAEMAARVFTDLSKWATDSDDKLTKRLTDVLSRHPTPAELIEARKLFARAIETPGGLKVQTIHAFCERLLQRFPLEAGVPPGFKILDDAEGARLRRQATDAVLGDAARHRTQPLGRALTTMIAFAAGDGFDQVLAGALSHRDWLETAERLLRHDSNGLDAADRVYRKAFGVREEITRGEIEREMADILPIAQLKRAAGCLAESSGAKDLELAARLAEAAKQTDAGLRRVGLQHAFMTQQNEVRSDKGFVSKDARVAHPDVHPILSRARDRFFDLYTEGRGLVVSEASVALLRIASAVMQRYVAGKAQRAALDFEDLIGRTANLLSYATAAEWVLYKLDGGLDHILVDEAQDTSPPQWRVIESLAQELFPITGARDRVRTVFAVGDEKQSIYSFQGAEPRMFAESGARFAYAAKQAGLEWRTVPLKLSFRTVAPLLSAVDRVFADRGRTPGVTTGEAPIEHVALRLGHAGFVEIWDPETPADTQTAEPWAPLSETQQPAPVTVLANRIADTIAEWLARGERLPSQNRPIRAGDILILVRRRFPFAGPVVAALKQRKIPVAGADRLSLVDQIAVKDLISLGEFLTLPEDDLSLAIVLKSPLFNFDDNDLLDIAPTRKGTLWSALIKAAKSNHPRMLAAVETLKRWRGIADQSPPFEFYAEVLDRDGGRRQLIQRLGPEAIDPITEFLNLAVSFDEGEPPSLTGFLEWLRSGSREVKRDMEHGRDEVRVLTVHGSKGLEAPIVFLPDTCSSKSPPRQGELVALSNAGLASGEEAWVWPVKGAGKLAPIKAGREAATAKEAEERNRLLYVAMTRARDRLYVGGFQGKKPRDPSCWYDVILNGLDGQLTEAKDHADRRIRRLETPQSVPAEPPRDLDLAAPEPIAPPAWAHLPAPSEPRLSIPLAPSKLAPYDSDEMGDDIDDQSPFAKPASAPVETPAATAKPAEKPAAKPGPRFAQSARAAATDEPASPSPLQNAGANRFLRGTLTHALLEHLPALDPATWQRTAEGFVATRGAGLPARTRASIVTETLAVLNTPAFAPVFGRHSLAEVPIVAEIPQPDGRNGQPGGPPLRLNGQVDRLALVGDTVLIIDYKTNRPPPSDVSAIAPAYIYQLSAYVLALGRIYPGKTVRAAILWTDGPRLMEIPAELIEAHTQQLWKLAA